MSAGIQDLVLTLVLTLQDAIGLQLSVDDVADLMSFEVEGQPVILFEIEQQVCYPRLTSHIARQSNDFVDYSGSGLLVSPSLGHGLSDREDLLSTFRLPLPRLVDSQWLCGMMDEFPRSDLGDDFADS